MLEVERFCYSEGEEEEEEREREGEGEGEGQGGDGRMNGVLVKVALPASCYATVCLREIIGGDLVVGEEKAEEVNVDEEGEGEDS